jgi:GNAT superfamily N-acetyltransferase
MNYHIRQITDQETHAVRHPILRPGKPVSTCIFKGDELKTTIHLGLYVNSEIIGVASFLKNPYRPLHYKNQYQLRGMAILETFQRKGLGNKLIIHAENLLKPLGVNVIWCNAREIAVNFYKRNGFKIISKPFDIPKIGIHYVMFKTF